MLCSDAQRTGFVDRSFDQPRGARLLTHVAHARWRVTAKGVAGFDPAAVVSIWGDAVVGWHVIPKICICDAQEDQPCTVSTGGFSLL